MIKYRGCRFCAGKGCLGCESELRKSEKAKTARIRNFKPTQDISDMAINIAKQLFPNPADVTKEKMLEQINTPTPMLTIKRDDAKGMEMLKNLLGGTALQEMAEGKTDEEFHEEFLARAEKIRIAQALGGGTHET